MNFFINQISNIHNLFLNKTENGSKKSILTAQNINTDLSQTDENELVEIKENETDTTGNREEFQTVVQDGTKKWYITEFDGSKSCNWIEGDFHITEFYDKNDVLIKTEKSLPIKRDQESYTQMTIYDYDTNGKMSHAKSYEFLGTTIGNFEETRYYYAYDDNGNVIKTKSANFNYTQQLYTISELDSENNIINSNSVPFNYKNIYVDKAVNEPTSQGNKGDCWLISCLLALSYTDEGKNLIKEAITSNDDGSFDVNFKGIDKSYHIDKETLDEKKKGISGYSKGDDDIFIVELAVEMYRDELRNNVDFGIFTPIYQFFQDLFANNIFSDEYIYKTNYNNRESSLEGGTSSQVFYLLAGGNPVRVKNANIEQIINEYEKTQNTALSVSFENAVTLKDTDGYNIEFYEHHAYAIKDTSSDFVTLVNPYDSANEMKIPLSEFKDVNFVYSKIDLV